MASGYGVDISGYGSTRVGQGRAGQGVGVGIKSGDSRSGVSCEVSAAG